MIKSVRVGLSVVVLCLVASVPAFAQNAAATVSKAQKTLTEMQNVIDAAAKRNANKGAAMAAPADATTVRRARTATPAAPAAGADTKKKAAAKKKKP